MDLKKTLTKMVEDGNVARLQHVKDMDSPGGLHHAAIWLTDRVKADYKGCLAKRILTDLNINEKDRVIRCHLDAFLESILCNEHRCQSSDLFLDALSEVKRGVLCEMAVFLRSLTKETS